MWHALSVSANWVGHSSVTSAQFGLYPILDTTMCFPLSLLKYLTSTFSQTFNPDGEFTKLTTAFYYKYNIKINIFYKKICTRKHIFDHFYFLKLVTNKFVSSGCIYSVFLKVLFLCRHYIFINCDTWVCHDQHRINNQNHFFVKSLCKWE